MSATVSPEPQNDTLAFNLSNHFLIATPTVNGDLFEKSLVYICQHTVDGALGLIVNKTTDIELQDLFDQVKLPLPRLDLSHMLVLEGGPLYTERGFVLHERIRPVEITPPSVNAGAQADGEEGIYSSSLLIPQADLELTTSTDIMHAIANGAAVNLKKKLPRTRGWCCKPKKSKSCCFIPTQKRATPKPCNC